MQPDYRHETLPLDTPDDDPRWAAYLDVFRMGLLDGRPPAAGVDVFRKHRRANNASLTMVTAEGPGLDGRQPVAAFSSCITDINCGAEPQPVLVVNTIAVKPSHRRRGLLKLMMQHQLDAAHDQGVPLAILSATEGTIYGRFGFGASNRQFDAKIVTSKIRWRDGAELAPGSVEFVEPSYLESIFEELTDAHHRRYRGVLKPLEQHRIFDLGEWDSRAHRPSEDLRAVVHFDPSGTPDGYAVFKHKGWETQPITSQVYRMIATTPEVERALWQALVDMDIVERLNFVSYPGDPLILSLVDEWAVERDGTVDAQWLRILDLPGAVAGRGFEADGRVVLEATDPMGYCAGTWLISADGGVGRAEPTQHEPDVRLGIDALARMWHGDRTAEELALGGQVFGETEGLRALSALFRVGEPPLNPWMV